MAMRSAMHHAGATALNELLRFPSPATEQRSIPCSCGHPATYQELRSKPVHRSGQGHRLAALLSVSALP